MDITIRLAGIAATIANRKEITLALEDETTYTEIVQQLGKLHPELAGVVLAADGKSLISATLLIRNGEEIIMPQMMAQSPKDGDFLQVTTFIVGG